MLVRGLKRGGQDVQVRQGAVADGSGSGAGVRHPAIQARVQFLEACGPEGAPCNHALCPYPMASRYLEHAQPRAALRQGVQAALAQLLVVVELEHFEIAARGQSTHACSKQRARISSMPTSASLVHFVARAARRAQHTSIGARTSI